MELEIIGNPVGEAVVDLNNFKRLLGKDWNMEKAVKQSTRITYLNKELEEQRDNFMNLIWLELNWGKIIDNLNRLDEKEVKIKWYLAQYKGWPMFKPKIANPDGRKFVIDVQMKDGEDMILIQSFCNGMSFNIKNFIDASQFNYGKEEWMFDLTDEYGGYTRTNQRKN